MQKVIVENGDIDAAIRKFQKISAETRKIVKAHEYYLRPGLKKAEKSKQAQRRNAAIEAKLRKKYAQWKQNQEKEPTQEVEQKPLLGE